MQVSKAKDSEAAMQQKDAYIRKLEARLLNQHKAPANKAKSGVENSKVGSGQCIPHCGPECLLSLEVVCHHLPVGKAIMLKHCPGLLPHVLPMTMGACVWVQCICGHAWQCIHTGA